MVTLVLVVPMQNIISDKMLTRMNEINPFVTHVCSPSCTLKDWHNVNPVLSNHQDHNIISTQWLWNEFPYFRLLSADYLENYHKYSKFEYCVSVTWNGTNTYKLRRRFEGNFDNSFKLITDESHLIKNAHRTNSC